MCQDDPEHNSCLDQLVLPPPLANYNLEMFDSCFALGALRIIHHSLPAAVCLKHLVDNVSGRPPPSFLVNEDSDTDSSFSGSDDFDISLAEFDMHGIKQHCTSSKVPFAYLFLKASANGLFSLACILKNQMPDNSMSSTLQRSSFSICVSVSVTLRPASPPLCVSMLLSFFFPFVFFLLFSRLIYLFSRILNSLGS